MDHMKRAPIPPAAGARCAPYINLELFKAEAVRKPRLRHSRSPLRFDFRAGLS